MNTVLQSNDLPGLEAKLVSAGFSIERRPNQAFLARRKRVVVNAYNSGKVLIQGGPDEEIQHVLQLVGQSHSPQTASESVPDWTASLPFPRIGIDEAGKGDYFGPLVIAAVRTNESQYRKLGQIGVRDSKTVAPGKIDAIADNIKAEVGRDNFAVVEIGPRRYNELYEKIGNLNELLAWGHARALENLLGMGHASVAISDQFGSPEFIRNALLKEGKKIELVQRPHAEADFSVAAASILARQRFLAKLVELSQKMGVELPRGSTNVDEAAKRIVAVKGAYGLVDCAKIHFKTTAKFVDDPAFLRRIVGGSKQ